MKAALAAVIGGFGLGIEAPQVARAAVVYPSPGVENATLYSFTAASSGDLWASFAGSEAGFSQQIGVLVNGSSSGVLGLDNHSSSIGASILLAQVTAGDTLIFFDAVGGLFTWYSDRALNADGLNHVFSKSVAAGEVFAGSRAGTYVGFEDLPSGGDLDYNDTGFVFGITAAVPEPSTWAMMILGFVALGATAYGRPPRAIKAQYTPAVEGSLP